MARYSQSLSSNWGMVVGVGFFVKVLASRPKINLARRGCNTEARDLIKALQNAYSHTCGQVNLWDYSQA